MAAEKVLRPRDAPPPAPKQPQVRTQHAFEDQYGARDMLQEDEARLYKSPPARSSRRAVPSYDKFITDSHKKLTTLDDTRGKGGREQQAQSNVTDVLNTQDRPSEFITSREMKVRTGRKQVSSAPGQLRAQPTAEVKDDVRLSGNRKKETPLDAMKMDKNRAGQRSVRDRASDGMPINILTWANAGDTGPTDKKVSDDARMHAAETRRQQRMVGLISDRSRE